MPRFGHLGYIARRVPYRCTVQPPTQSLIHGRQSQNMKSKYPLSLPMELLSGKKDRKVRSSVDKSYKSKTEDYVRNV